MLDRRLAETQVRALSRSERRTLKGLGVRFGAFSLYLPALTTREARLLGEPFAALARPGWRPAADALTRPAASHAAAGGAGVARLARGRRLRRSGRRAGAARRAGARGRSAGRRRDPRDAAIARRTRLEARPGGADPARPRLHARPQERRGRSRSVAPARVARRRARRSPPLRRSRRSRPSPSRRRRAAARGASPPVAGPPQEARTGERGGDTCRADVWLWRARFFKTRSLAARVDRGRRRARHPRRAGRRASTSRAGRSSPAT